MVLLGLLAVLLAGAAPSLTAAETLFGLVDTGELFTSTDQGSTWGVRATMPVVDAVALSALATSNDLMIVTRSGSVLSSTDAGVSWFQAGSVPASDVVDLSITGPTSALVLTESGTLYTSADGGILFAPLASLTATDFVGLTPSAGANLFALTRTGAIHRSSDAGSTWTPVGTVPVSDAVALRSIGNDLYLLTGAGTLFESKDGGATWPAIGTTSQIGMTTLAPLTGVGLTAASQEGHIAISADGVGWSWQGSINQLRLIGLGTDAPVGSIDDPEPLAGTLTLSAPWPNPQRGPGGATLRLGLTRPETVRLELLDVTGRLIARRPPVHFAREGSHMIHWDPGTLAPGIYFLRLSTQSDAGATTRWVVLD